MGERSCDLCKRMTCTDLYNNGEVKGVVVSRGKGWTGVVIGSSVMECRQARLQQRRESGLVILRLLMAEVPQTSQQENTNL